MKATPDLLGRLGGLAAVVGGLLWAAGAYVGGTQGGTQGGDPGLSETLFFASTPLLLAGIFGMYARYGRETRGMGRTGFAQAAAGLLLLALALGAGLFAGVEGSAGATFFGLIILALGLSLVGMESLKHRLLPRWNALPLAMGLLLPLATVAAPVGTVRLVLSVLFGIAWLPLGALIFSGRPRDRGRAS